MPNPDPCPRYLDTRIDEQKRKLGIKAMPMSLLMPNGKGKHYALNLMDTPGHVNFTDEMAASMRICDGVLLVVDAVDGSALPFPTTLPPPLLSTFLRLSISQARLLDRWLHAPTTRSAQHRLSPASVYGCNSISISGCRMMLNTERIAKLACQEKIPIVLCINKIDRLILELKLPPQDAYFKLKHVIDEVNATLAAYGGNPAGGSSDDTVLHPDNGQALETQNPETPNNVTRALCCNTPNGKHWALMMNPMPGTPNSCQIMHTGN
jgi:hypothetical protein